MEFSIHVLLYGIYVTGILLYDNRTAARAREARLARVEADLAEAQVNALQARLQPHFLFNALHTISSVMYTDPAAADTMLARLADLLRRTLRVDATEIPLRDELEMVRLWLSVMEARFGDRMQVRLDVPDAMYAALVPPLILQPLLENALKHAEPAAGGTLHIAVSARRILGTDGGDTLTLEVRDDGPGLRVAPEEAFASGVGLSTTRQRVRTLHGEAGTMRLELAPGGGLAVRLALPWREAADA
jgi:LytS/YehU family sensor histidine kinase